MSSPFDEARYNALLEGLEISELMLSEIVKNNTNFRFDAEYFKEQYLLLDKLFADKSSVYLTDISSSIINFGAYSLCNQIEYLNEGVPYLNVADIKDNVVDFQNAKRINEELSKTVLRKSLVHNNQVLLTIAGTIGNAAVANDLPLYTNSNQAIANITLNPDVSPYYISTYLNSKYGKLQTTRLIISNVQPNLLLNQVKEIKIVVPEKNFQAMIEGIVKSAYDKLEQSKQLYAESESLLLEELDLKNWQPENKNISVKLFSDFQKSGRLDAEYYQPKYDEMLAHLSKFATTRLEDIVTVKKSIEPGSEAYQDSGVPFLRVANLTKFGLSEPDIFLNRSQYDIDDLRPKRDTILLSKDGSVGIAYKIESDLDAITSGALLHLNVFNSDFLPDYLTLVLNSIIVKLQAERDAGGSIISHWKPSEISQVIIPKLPLAEQKVISQKLGQSFALKSESKRLLNDAKIAVEKEIEK